jgi:predicted KAP-like P-loop ATPase
MEIKINNLLQHKILQYIEAGIFIAALSIIITVDGIKKFLRMPMNVYRLHSVTCQNISRIHETC